MDHPFFDAYVCIGPRPSKHPAHAWKLADVLEEMAHCSIAGALVTHTLCVNYDATRYNLKLLDELRPHRHLYPLWNVMPHHTGEFWAPDELIRRLREHDVRAVTLHPTTNRWNLFSETSRELLTTLQEHEILTIVKPGEVEGYPGLERLLAQYPRLPVLLTHATWSDQRCVVPLMQRFANLHLTFNHYQVHYGPERLTAMGFGKRLVFSSNAPEMSMGAHRTYVSYADVDAGTQADIAGGNLRRLLKGQGPTEARVNPGEDAFMRAARLGQPQPVPVYDLHVHMLHEGLQGGGGGYTMWDGGPKGTYALMRRLGYAGAGIMSWMVVSADAEGSNEMIREALDQFPPGFCWGLGTFDPTHYSQEEMKQKIETLYADRRFIGLKPYTRFGLRYDHAKYDVWWEYANAVGRYYALIHPNAGDLAEIRNLAPKYPNIVWIPAHCGGSYAAADAAIDCIKRYPNVCAEITLTPVTFGIVDYMAREAGAERIVYGSDLPMRDPRQQLGWVVYSRLSVEDKTRILSGNAQRLLRRAGWLPAA